MAISGSVKTFEETVLRFSGATASPRKWYIAIRPCMAATEASAKTPVTSPAAYTPGEDVRDTLSVQMWPDSLSRTPDSSRFMPCVLGTAPTAIRQWVPLMTRPSERVTSTRSPTRLADSARERPMTFIPRRRKTSSRTAAASGSSPGSTRSRDDTRVTREPRAW